jgi:hypothetical protein
LLLSRGLPRGEEGVRIRIKLIARDLLDELSEFGIFNFVEQLIWRAFVSLSPELPSTWIESGSRFSKPYERTDRERPQMLSYRTGDGKRHFVQFRESPQLPPGAPFLSRLLIAAQSN